MSEDAPRLYLATPPLAETRDFLPALTSALSAGDVASLLIRLAGDDPRKNEELVRALAPLAQEKDVAVLVEGSATVALRAKADGAHINGSGEELADAIEKLSPKYIVGASGLELRDDAMRAGEMGVDYVLFEGADLPELIERVAWWVELFNIPCVARAASLAEVAPLAAAGADFVMLDDAVWTDQRGPAAAVAEALGALAQGEAEG
ncbi:thiamine phosphate synthase [Methylocystis sp. MJC1]|jgi:thiamine-phosphate pyrophosphorylase|uniref:thiamine phosphate synthase n=1 Tax=Methylocystis sp. MJC1 TaxID=2654282 RepID=UPI0013EAEBFA|nr:thiamine phosphate synthase [Methylocystis sp. MJC1]KAF2991944.1 Thiamine-phosphate synthase [Methylocystis sp. MJC1]MBU6525434.1 thiamine phosphate synthase [Methylocystis sp. MJC1]UZX11925.1 thiamine phosphate synthase [Methylocystis sp. MJC1]